MRWSGQQVQADGVGSAVALPGMAGLLRSVRTPEFAGTVFHEVEARSALSKVPLASSMPFTWTVNPYRGCSHACVYCLGPTTRVLLADGRTRPIAALRVGDAVMGTELVRPGRVDGQRRYVRTTVLAHWSTTKPAHAVRLAGGTELVASGEHRFLTEQGWRHVSGGWCRSGRRPRLRTGSALLGPGPATDAARPHTPAYRQGYLCGLVRGDGGESRFPSPQLELEALGRAHHFLADAAQHIVDLPVAARVGAGRIEAGRIEAGRIAPPVRGGIAPIADVVHWPVEPGEDWCAGFLGGLIDARGAAARGELRISHTEQEIIGRIAGALHRLGFRFAVEPGPGPATTSVRLLGGVGEYLRLVQAADPAVSRHRDLDGAAVVGGAELAVVDVRPLGIEIEMYDITTGTGDFIAEGVVSHNCFARNTHTYLDLDAGADFDSQIIVKVNVARVLSRELRAAKWQREPVAMGTNTDPYQRAEGRYKLMPGIIEALARSGTPFSVLTKGTVLTRDLPALAAAAADVPVGLGVSIALLDRPLQALLEPGTPTPAARLDMVRRITDAGLPCGVMVAPVLPLLTDSAEALDTLLGQIAAAGATGATVMALHLRRGTREWFLQWLEREHPELIEPYAELYRRGAYVDQAYRKALAQRAAPLLRRHGLAGGMARAFPAAQIPAASPAPPVAQQLSLL